MSRSARFLRDLAPDVQVQHIDGRQGTVRELRPVDGLPGAVVQFHDARETLPLGYLQRQPFE